MLRDELKTKKELKKIYLEEFNKKWYNGLKDNIFKLLRELIPSEENIFTYINSFYLPFDFGNKSYGQFLFFLRSKLWDEGINLLLDSNANVIITVRKKGDKFSDCFYLYNGQNLDYDYIYDLADFADKTLEEVVKIFTTNINNPEQTIVKNKKNKSIKKIEDNNLVGKDDTIEKSAIDLIPKTSM